MNTTDAQKIIREGKVALMQSQLGSTHDKTATGCNDYQLDLAGATFGVCKCGLAKSEHSFAKFPRKGATWQPKANKAPAREHKGVCMLTTALPADELAAAT